MSTSPDTTAAREAFAALPPTVIAAEAPWPSPPRPTAGIAAAASLVAWSGDDPAAVVDRHSEAAGDAVVWTVDEPAARSSAASDNDRCGNCHRAGLSDRSGSHARHGPGRISAAEPAPCARLGGAMDRTSRYAGAR